MGIDGKSQYETQPENLAKRVESPAYPFAVILVHLAQAWQGSFSLENFAVSIRRLDQDTPLRFTAG